MNAPLTRLSVIRLAPTFCTSNQNGNKDKERQTDKQSKKSKEGVIKCCKEISSPTLKYEWCNIPFELHEFGTSPLFIALFNSKLGCGKNQRKKSLLNERCTLNQFFVACATEKKLVLFWSRHRHFLSVSLLFFGPLL